MGHLLNIKPTLFSGGERFPVIVSDDGMPEFYPNTFLVDALRSKHKQFNTLISAASALKVLRAWELLENTDIIARMKNRNFLKVSEMDRLINAMWEDYGYLQERIQQTQIPPRSGRKVRSLAKFRREHKQKSAPIRVKPETVGCRMVYVIRYLEYLGCLAVDQEEDVVKRDSLRRELEKMTKGLATRAPDAFGGDINAEYQRLGLTYEVEGLLREVITPGHAANPWTEKVQVRNCLVIKILLGLGIRGGELLNLRIDDIDFRLNKVHIRRLPDNPNDPRLYEPNVKTLARVLTMKDSLAGALQDYIVNERRKLKGARSHDFLLVSSMDGAPLSRTAFNHIFEAVRDRVPGIPEDFCAHICRHTWNDRYSDFCDKRNVDPESERKTRCRVMGWALGSKMAYVYTKRSTEEKVNAHLLAQQEYISDDRLGGLLNEITIEAED